MISFYAYHRNPALRHTTIDRMASLIAAGRLVNSTDCEAGKLGLIAALAHGERDLTLAHDNCGFPAPLLYLAESVFDGLAPEDAPHFAIALVRAASLDGDLSDVTGAFLKWMFEQAVAELGPSRIRTTAGEAGHLFAQLGETGEQTPAQRQKAKALAKRARRQGMELPSPEEALVAKALGAALDPFDQHLAPAVHWIAHLSQHPTENYRRFARKLLELVELA